MGTPTGRFRRSERLLAPRDFRRVQSRGARVTSPGFVLLLSPSDCRTGASRRIGITTSRKVGRAVERNRVKRSVREWFRHERERLPECVEMVVIARRPAVELSGPGIAAELSSLAARAARHAARESGRGSRR